MTNLVEVKFERASEKNEDVVAILERWLEQAKSGEIVAISIAGGKSDGSQMTEFDSGQSRALVLQSATTTLLFRLANRILEW